MCEVSLEGAARVAGDSATLAFDWDERARAHRDGALERAAAAAQRQRLARRAPVACDCRGPRRRCAAPAANSAARNSSRPSAAAGGRACEITSSVLSAGRGRARRAANACGASRCPTRDPGTRADRFIGWGGAERWWRTSAPARRIRALAAAARGHATLVRAADKSPARSRRWVKPDAHTPRPEERLRPGSRVQRRATVRGSLTSRTCKPR